MTTPEKIGSQETQILRTALPDITVRDLDTTTLPDLKKLFDENDSYFAKGGLFASELYKRIEKELTDTKPVDIRRMGVWQNDTLVGYIGINPSDEPQSDHEVEIAYAIDQDHAKQGVASAAIEAVTERENDKGNTVIAEVEHYNYSSKRLLGKLGFESSDRNNIERREVFVRGTLTIEEMLHRLGL
jgi:RimJ/RimL family protein N-acetyltransferase